MAEGTIPIHNSGQNSLAPAANQSADVDGDKFLNSLGDVLLLVEVGSSATVLTVTSVPCSHGRLGNLTFTCPINTKQLLGPFDKSAFNDVDGYCHITYDQVTNVKVTAIRQSN